MGVIEAFLSVIVPGYFFVDILVLRVLFTTEPSIFEWVLVPGRSVAAPLGGGGGGGSLR